MDSKTTTEPNKRIKLHGGMLKEGRQKIDYRHSRKKNKTGVRGKRKRAPQPHTTTTTMLDHGLSTPRTNKPNKPNKPKVNGANSPSSNKQSLENVQSQLANNNAVGKKSNRKKQKKAKPTGNANNKSGLGCLQLAVPGNADNKPQLAVPGNANNKPGTGCLQLAVPGNANNKPGTGCLQLAVHQNQPSTTDAINSSGKKTRPNKQKNKKKKKKPLENSKSGPIDILLERPLERPLEKSKGPLEKPKKSSRIVCTAEKTLFRCIDQKRSLGRGGIHSDKLLDLPKEEINNLPDVPYKRTKTVVLVSSPAGSDRAVAEIRAELSTHQRQLGGENHALKTFQYLGFDTETKPKFHKGGEKNHPALIQLATQTTAYLFRLTYLGMDQNASALTESLRNLLSDRNIIKVGVGIHNDVVDLKCVHGSHCCGDGSSYLDLAPLVKQRWPKIQRAGLRNLTATVLQFRLSKAQQTKNWEMKRLTPLMEDYAAADAHVALDLLAAIVG